MVYSANSFFLGKADWGHNLKFSTCNWRWGVDGAKHSIVIWKKSVIVRATSSSSRLI